MTIEELPAGMTIEELPAGMTGRAFAAMQALRPGLADQDEFARRVDEQQRPEGYRLVAVSRTTARSPQWPVFRS